MRKESRKLARHEFGRRLRGGVGVVTTERVDLAVEMLPFAVVIDLVGGDHDDDAGLGQRTHGFEQGSRCP